LYDSLKSAVISESKVTIEKHKFPVETDETLGSTILLRKAHIDLWIIFQSQILSHNLRVMFIMGPSGVGKVSIISNYLLF
jgi:putative ribosome biogenesis GTPase RsgA